MPERKYPANTKNKLGFHVTSEGLATLREQLEELKSERPVIAEKLRAAMADKDFRENAYSNYKLYKSKFWKRNVVEI